MGFRLLNFAEKIKTNLSIHQGTKNMKFASLPRVKSTSRYLFSFFLLAMLMLSVGKIAQAQPASLSLAVVEPAPDIVSFTFDFR